MKIIVERNAFLMVLQCMIHIADKKHTIPVLGHFLVNIQDNKVFIKASDLETEMISEVSLYDGVLENTRFTLPARKVYDITKSLPDGALLEIDYYAGDHRITLRSDQSVFVLSTMLDEQFPAMETDQFENEVMVVQSDLVKLLKKVSFAMANNDVRYFLNGALWELSANCFKMVATDGHRMALSQIKLLEDFNINLQVIVPRKAILELIKILSASDEVVTIKFGANYFSLTFNQFQFTSKLIDGRYPNYTRVIPQNNDKEMSAKLSNIKSSLLRTSILSNEKYRGIRLKFQSNLLSFATNNPEKECATDQIEVNYAQPDSIEMGFNITYLLDVLSVIDTEKVRFLLSEPDMSLLIKEMNSDDSVFVVMPIRL